MNTKIIYIYCFCDERVRIKPERKWEAPISAFPFVRPGIDQIILPGNIKHINEFAGYFVDHYTSSGFTPSQVWFTSGKNDYLIDDVKEELLDQLQQFIQDKTYDVIWVQQSNELPAHQLALRLGISCQSDSLLFKAQYHKGILHPLPEMNNASTSTSSDVWSVIQQVVGKINIPLGYQSHTQEQLLSAYDLLRNQTDSVGFTVVLKPMFTDSGKGILFIKQRNELLQYRFPFGAVVLEQFLELDRTEQGNIVSPVVHFVGSKIIYPIGDQILDNVTHVGNTSHSVANQEVLSQCIQMTKQFLAAVKPCGSGGLDFLIQKNVPYLVDINLNRWCGGLWAKMFLINYEGEFHNKSFQLFGLHSTLDIVTMATALTQANIHYKPTVSDGIAIIEMCPNSDSNYFIAIGDNLLRVNDIQIQFHAIHKRVVAEIEIANKQSK